MRQICDVNVLLALVTERHAHHKRCEVWWKGRDPSTPLLICREVQLALFRLLASETVMGEDALTLPQAWSLYATLVKSGGFTRVLEPRGLDVEWERYCRPFKRSQKVVMDAYLAAFARAGGYTLVTLDKGFVLFDKLDVLLLTE